jgi:hypothetical protein
MTLFHEHPRPVAVEIVRAGLRHLWAQWDSKFQEPAHTCPFMTVFLRIERCASFHARYVWQKTIPSGPNEYGVSSSSCVNFDIVNILKPTGHVMNQQFNIQQL